ncbi:hypothetical protein D3C84_1118420 [compost metagenome]
MPFPLGDGACVSGAALVPELRPMPVDASDAVAVLPRSIDSCTACKVCSFMPGPSSLTVMRSSVVSIGDGSTRIVIRPTPILPSNPCKIAFSTNG